MQEPSSILAEGQGGSGTPLLCRASAPSLLGVLFVALGAFGFSSGIIFNRAIEGMTGPQIAFFRALSGFAFLSVLLPWHPQTLRPRSYRSAIPLLIGLGASVGATATLYMTSLRYTTAANAVLLNNTSAVYVALLAPWLLKEARPRFTWISLALALVGVILLIDPANMDFQSGSWFGDLLAALTGITYGGAMLFSRLLGVRAGNARIEGLTQSWWSVGMAALAALPLALGTPWAAVRANWPWLVALGTLALGIPYLFFFLGLKRVKAQVASIVALLEPVCGVLIGIFMFQEIPNLWGFGGMLLVLAAMALITRE